MIRKQRLLVIQLLETSTLQQNKDLHIIQKTKNLVHGLMMLLQRKQNQNQNQKPRKNQKPEAKPEAKPEPKPEAGGPHSHDEKPPEPSVAEAAAEAAAKADENAKIRDAYVAEMAKKGATLTKRIHQRRKSKHWTLGIKNSRTSLFILFSLINSYFLFIVF